MKAHAHIDFADGTSAWVDLTELLPPLPRWGFDISADMKSVVVDRETKDRFLLPDEVNDDVALAMTYVSAFNRVLPRPEGKRYDR